MPGIKGRHKKTLPTAERPVLAELPLQGNAGNAMEAMNNPTSDGGLYGAVDGWMAVEDGSMALQGEINEIG